MRIELSGCTVDTERRTVEGPSGTELTETEARLLAHLAARPGQDVDRDELLAQVWGWKATGPTRVVDVTVRRLRAKIEPDPARPRHLLTVRGSGYRLELLADVPAPVPDADPRPFVGRERELAALREALDRARVVTVLGPGGIGKTRLASRVAGAAWRVDLAGSATSAQVLRAVGGALGVVPGRDAPLRVSRALAARGRSVVLLDDAEAGADALAAHLRAWTAAAPLATFLVTTRRRLRVAGEHAIEVGPLDEDDAVALFAARAAEAVPGWTATGSDLDAVRELVRLLDGLPLAIELAAARVDLLSPRRMVERLRRGADVLGEAVSGTVEWSWRLLGEAERAVLARSSVFRGSFTVDAAEAVAGLPDALRHVAALRDRSLLRSEGGRLRMYRVVRDFAARRLEEDDPGPVRDRYVRFYATASARWTRELRGPRSAEALEELLLEADELLAVHRVAREIDPALAATIALALEAPLVARGPLEVLEELMDAAVADADASGDPALRARTRIVRAAGHRARGDAARADLDEALRLAAGDPGLEAEAHRGLAILMRVRGDTAGARRHHEAALAGFEAGGRTRDAGITLANLATSVSAEGRHDEAAELYVRGLARLRASGARRDEGILLVQAARTELDRGRPDRARAIALEALAIHRALANHRFVASSLTILGDVAADPAAARANWLEALGLFRAIGDVEAEVSVREKLARI